MGKKILNKAISVILSLVVLYCVLCTGFTAFAQENEFDPTATDSSVLFTYDSDIFAGCSMTVDKDAMGLEGDVSYKWYKDKQLFATTQGITFLSDDIGSKFYVEIETEQTTYKSYNIVPVKKPDYYGYSKLNEKQQTLYNIMVENISSFKTSFEIDYSLGITSDDIAHVNILLSHDHPEIFWYRGSFQYYMQSPDLYVVEILPKYTLYNESATEQQIKEAQFSIKNKLFYTVSQMYQELAVTTEYTEALWIHDKVASMLTYQRSVNDQTIYGALIEGKAVCSGYSKLNQIMLQYIGIDAFTITGVSINPTTNQYEGHAWNLMWIDHHCLYTDVTWDDQKHHVFHLYFARTVDNMAINHTMDELSESIKPQGDEHCCEYNYFAYYHQDHAVQSDEDGNFDVKYIASLKDEKIKDKAYGIVVYDQTGEEFMQWLNSDLSKNLSDILNNMSLKPGSYSVSTLKMGGDTLGTEVHIYFEKVQEENPVAYTVSGNIKSFGEQQDAVTVSLYKDGSTEYSQRNVLYGTDISYSFSILESGNYKVEVKKNGHITSVANVTVDTNLVVNFDLYLYGDGDLDGAVTIIDATLIQKFLARSKELNEQQLIICDADKNGDVNILDATKIQMLLANKIESL